MHFTISFVHRGQYFALGCLAEALPRPGDDVTAYAQGFSDAIEGTVDRVTFFDSATLGSDLHDQVHLQVEVKVLLTNEDELIYDPDDTEDGLLRPIRLNRRVRRGGPSEDP